MNAAVEVENVDRVFTTRGGAVTALSGVSLSVAPGEFVSLIGPSGCGKSTLLRLVADLDEPTAGSISVFGKTARRARLDQEYGIAFQQAGLLPWRTVAANIELPLELHGVGKAARARRAAELVALVGLDDFADRFPDQLSGGMQQRVAIARAIAEQPRLLLMDEPFGALDALTRARLQDELLAIVQKTQSTVVMVTHDVDEAVLLSDKIVMMTNGPSATIGEVLPVKLQRPRNRVELAEDRDYVHYRKAVIDFLYTRQGHVEKAA